MKTKLAATLSLSGVLVAGSAAALVNTQVLTGGDSSGSGVSVASVPASVDTTVPTSLDPAAPITDPTLTTLTTLAGLPTVPSGDPGTTVGSTVGSILPGTSAPTASGSVGAAPVSSQAVYNVGDAGAITLDTAGDVLTVVAATPKSGWTVYKVERKSPLNIEVKFRSSTVEVEFEASLLVGVIGTKVTSRSLVPPPPAGSVPGPVTTIDDDDHDEYDDDDEDDDDEDDDDEDDDDEDDDEDDEDDD